MGPLDKFILRDDSLRATATGFELQFHSHWYRSLPLSCMNCKASIDGEGIDEKNIYIEANGNKYPFNEIATQYNEWLFITDAATLHVSHEPLERGKDYTVEFKLDLFIPYIIVSAEGKTLLASSTVTKKLNCQ
ncbi:hypothetical protein FRZ67_05805 [Panacibacter ginsenosidivorans]|uniref:C-deglycosylation enzyme beta subunit n=1 Tax=Panacibacter ginsenosidivorans TaxID=1813871 RepID=A0A5B8V6K2_9BACT|nr:DUF6379 domain-containing protein [Panacibacter ginsenosidivorans]QEC66839.1 hypothetical protein FRZ67_05805 [Panacibacter ginsenosidivorans]